MNFQLSLFQNLKKMNNSKTTVFQLGTLCIMLAIIAISCKNSNEKSSIVNLKCEHLVNPIGIDTDLPRFSWQIDGQKQGIFQTSFQIFLGTDSLEVEAGKGNVWNSGKIKSGAQIAVYSKKSLKPFTKYFWIVKVWGKLDTPINSSKVASFETGMMESKNWQGDWISDTRDINLKPAPWFRKEFTASKTIQSARAYIAVGGLYELYINGKKVGNHRLDPMYTRFDRRTLYVTHDVTNLVSEGKNAVGILLGNGWYNHQSTAVCENFFRFALLFSTDVQKFKGPQSIINGLSF